MVLEVRIVHGLSGQLLGTVAAEKDWDVSDLKWEIRSIHGISDDEQRLVLNGRVLANRESLDSIFANVLPEVALVRLSPEYVNVIRKVERGYAKLKDLAEEYRCDRDIILAAVRIDSTALGQASTALKADIDVVTTAVTCHGCALAYADDKLKNNFDVVLSAVQRDGLAVRHASSRLQSNSKIAMAAVQQNGFALELLPEKMRGQSEIARAAIEREGEAFQYLPPVLQKERDLAIMAVRSNCEALRCIPRDLTFDEAVIKNASMGVRMRGYAGLRYFESVLAEARATSSGA